MFGINAELLIDHAWGYEPCTIADIKAYKPDESSVSSGQVLKCPYNNRQARIIVHEMTDLLVLDLVEKNKTNKKSLQYTRMGYIINPSDIPHMGI